MVTHPIRTQSSHGSGRRQTDGRTSTVSTTKKSNPSSATGTPMNVDQALEVTLLQSMTSVTVQASVSLPVKCSNVRYAAC